MSLGILACSKTPLGIILSANNALTMKFLSNSHPDFIFCELSLGYFLVPGPLGGLKSVLWDVFGTLIRIKLLKEYLSWVEKSIFFQGVGPGFLVKNDQIWKSAFFT